MGTGMQRSYVALCVTCTESLALSWRVLTWRKRKGELLSIHLTTGPTEGNSYSFEIHIFSVISWIMLSPLMFPKSTLPVHKKKTWIEDEHTFVNWQWIIFSPLPRKLRARKRLLRDFIPVPSGIKWNISVVQPLGHLTGTWKIASVWIWPRKVIQVETFQTLTRQKAL